MRFLLPVLFLLSSAFVYAQGELTVAEIGRQSKFIEAKRDALLGKTDAAIAQFEALAAEDPANDATYFELARLFKAKELFDPAIDQMQKAYAARPNPIYAAYLADLFRETGRHKEGAALYTSLRKQDPSDEDYYLEEAAALVRAQDIKGAIGVYNQLESRIGVNAELARLKHALYLGTGDAKRAEKELTALVDAQPRNLENRHLLAGFYVAQGNAKAANQVYKAILKLEPADVRAQLALQNAGAPAKPGDTGSDDQLLALLGRSDVDLDLKIGKLLPLVQGLARSQDARSGTGMDRAEITRAVHLAKELRRVHPDEAKAAALLGDIYFQSGQLNEAADAYIATLELDDNVYPVWEQLLGTLYLSNRTVELRKYAEEALDLYPNRPSVYVHYAIGEALRSNFGEAESLLSEARLMVSTQAEATRALDELATAFSVLNSASSGSAVKAEMLPGGPNGPLAFLLTNATELDALKGYDVPGNTNALYLELLGDAAAEAGDKATATAAYARAKAAGSKSKELPRKMSKLGS
ncbi:tetratricopeptide repeat protein [Lewinella sp. 4G2]|uniref:tetratricopeptide repeat protein n=1 Tax=Lewinella sp. 4G2 TaxID=1803372 RepID=UPI0007B48658|nr:tetratricopeptide repeat protein [Lewinella sp. 4G2]OAV43089.1 hypothetical protein A3850_000610 [Lewinella sp. 4G2]